MSDQKSGFASTVLSFLTGAALGAGLALLFAPQSGEDTRKKLKDASNKMSDDAKKNYEKIYQEAQKVFDQVKNTSDKTLAQVKNFVETTKESMKKEIVEEVQNTPVKETKKRTSAAKS